MMWLLYKKNNTNTCFSSCLKCVFWEVPDYDAHSDTVTSNPYPQIPVPRDPAVCNEKKMDNAVAKPSGKQPTYWLENAPSTVQVGRYYVTCGRWATWVKGNIAASRPD